MSEIVDLIAILAAIDVAVSDEDEDRRAQVAALVPAYRVGDRFGWNERFVERPDVRELPTIEEAMRNLAEPSRFASMLPRRLLAVALAARMFGDRFGPGGSHEDDSLRALIVPGILSGLRFVPTPPPRQAPHAPGLDDPVLVDRARELLDALADPDDLVRIEDWRGFLTRHADLVSAQLIRLPTPCSTTVTEQAVPGGGPIAVLQTSLCVGGVDLKTVATKFLDPARWPRCSPWWCGMHPAPTAQLGMTRFLEVVAADCETGLLGVAVFLDFAKPVDWPGSTVVTYNMSPDQGDVGDLHANDAVDVDRGAIEVRQERDHVHVTTTKRVRFTNALDGAALAMIACWVGYGDAATDVICNCSGGRSIDCGVASPCADALDRFIDLAHTCVTDAGRQAHRVAGRLGLVTSSPENATDDAVSVAALALRGWGKVATTFVEAIGDLVRPPAQPSTLVASLPSRPFSFDPAASVGCSLSLAGPMHSPYGDQIDTTRVTISPPTLGVGARTFALAVDPTGLEGSAFTGEVVARSLVTGLEIGRARAYVIVP